MLGRVGTHLFQPATRMALITMVQVMLTTWRTVPRLERALKGVLGMEVIRTRLRSGFVMNALLVLYSLAAITILESAHASAVEIDKAMRLDCAHSWRGRTAVGSTSRRRKKSWKGTLT